jgi:hypothetical protein
MAIDAIFFEREKFDTTEHSFSLSSSSLDTGFSGTYALCFFVNVKEEEEKENT